MSFKFDCLVAILNKLDRREKITIRSLTDDLTIAERTAHRYIKTLMDAKFPIGYDREQASYIFEGGYSLKKPSFSPQESLTFGLARCFLKNYGSSLQESLDSIEKKAAIPSRDTSKFVVLTPESRSVGIGEHLALIHDAAFNMQKIEMVYKALSTGKAVKRKVDPYYLFYNDGFWQLRGFCHLRKKFRAFALDRIISLKLLDEYFLPRDISQETEISGLFGAYIDGKPVEVIVRFDKEIRKYVERIKWHQAQDQRGLPDGRLEVTFTANGIEGIRYWLYRWLPRVEVVSPDILRDAVTQELETALKKHRGKI